MSRETLREVGLAVLVAAVFAVGPFTPNEWLPATLIGAAVGGCVFAYRRWTRAAPADADALPHDADAAPPVEPIAWARLGTWLALVLLWALSFAPTLAWLWREWTRSVWVNDHGIFMPLIIVYLGWTILRGDPVRSPAESPWGFALLGAGLALALVDALAETHYIGMAGLLLTLPGLTLLVLGARRTRLLGVPLVLSLLMTPIPFTLSTHLYLRHMTADAVEPLLRALGVAVFREDTVMHLTTGVFVVADACSGFSTLYASIAVSLVLVFLVKSPSRRVALLLLAPLLAIGANIIRVLALILLAHGVGRWTLDTPLHEATGVAAFAIVLVVLFLVSREKATP